MENYLNRTAQSASYYEDLDSEIQVFEFTDSICTWCWGSEPQLRALEFLYPDTLNVDFITGRLVKDIRDFFAPTSGIKENPKLANEAIASHWQEASERHQMPILVDTMDYFDEQRLSSYPNNIAYKAAQFQSRIKAKRFLRLMREAIYMEGKATNTTAVLAKLAEEAGLDLGMFIEDFKDKDAYRAFLDDKDACAYYQVNGFPAFLIRIGNKETILRGYQGLENFLGAIDKLSEGKYQAQIPELNEEHVLSYFDKFKSAFSVELACAFRVSKEDIRLISILNKLVSDKHLSMPYGKDLAYYVFNDSDPLHISSWESAQ